MKLARELSKRQTGRTLYLLDEPTTGLHFDDVRKLLEVLHRLTDLGNTVVIIEHNLDIIRNADYILDMGPEGGEGGGRVIAHGTPEQVSTVCGIAYGQLSGKVLCVAAGRCNAEWRAESCGAAAAGDCGGGRQEERAARKVRGSGEKDWHADGARQCLRPTA